MVSVKVMINVNFSIFGETAMWWSISRPSDLILLQEFMNMTNVVCLHFDSNSFRPGAMHFTFNRWAFLFGKCSREYL